MEYDEEQYAQLRRAMVERQLRRRGIVDARVLEAMATIPRHQFVPLDEQLDVRLQDVWG